MRTRRTPTPAATFVMTDCGVVASPAVVRAAPHPLTYRTEAAQRGHSSVGRALALQARGHGFEPRRLHHSLDGIWGDATFGKSVQFIEKQAGSVNREIERKNRIK